MTFDPFMDMFNSFFIIFIVIAVVAVVFFIFIFILIVRAIMGGGKRSEKRKQQLSPYKDYPDEVYKNKESTQICQYCGEKIDVNANNCPQCGEKLK